MSHTHESALALERWEQGQDAALTGSVETLGQPIDKYEIANFAKDDPEQFIALMEHLAPRDAEIMLCFAVLDMRPTDISALFGKAGHRSQEDVHKAAHKLAGLIEFGPLPTVERIHAVLEQHALTDFAEHAFAPCVQQYAQKRDFKQVTRLIGQRGLRRQMLRAFKALHASKGRDAGLLAGWLLWLVDGSSHSGQGWRTRQRGGRQFKLGPTVFRTPNVASIMPRATGRGGRGQRPDTVKITRRLKFMLRGNA